ncbi:hypothetical protein C2E23DRAFT_229812 [Lenzites betulinus]|nr:hypothetical protein C2E23DRAFT_229812 [Lenzites betulinus]
MPTAISAAPKRPCVRCNQTHDTPAAFLIECCKCERAWHHTCHIPPVTETELLARFEADEKGKRDGGLGAWQCRRCSKRPRVELPAVAPPRHERTLATTLSNAPAETSQDNLLPFEPRRPASLAIPVTSNKLNPEPQAAHAQPYTKPAVIEVGDDNDIDSEIVEVVSAAAIAQPAKVKPTDLSVGPSTVRESVQTLPGRISPPRVKEAPPTKLVETIRGARLDIPGKLAVPLGGKRSTKHSLVITPLLSSGRQAAEVVRPASSSRPRPSGVPASIVSSVPHPANTDTPTAPVANYPDTLHPVVVVSPLPRQPSPSSTPKPITQPVITGPKDIRQLISTMRAKGQLEPPPVIDYVHRGPATRKATPLVPSAVPRAHAASRSQTRALEEDQVERALGVDIAGDAMDVDPAPPPAPLPDAEPEPDPHNIDDLYGDIAPRFRDEPLHAHREEFSGRPWSGLRALLEKRRASDAEPPPVARLEDNDRPGDQRRPRKCRAQQLRGKALRKRQADGLVYNAYDSHGDNNSVG